MTIYALSSGPGISGVAIIRISGLEAANIIKSLTGKEIPKPRVATLAKINNIKWIEDPTNKNVDFDRNYLRKDIIPSIKKRWPKVQTTIPRLSSLAENNQKLLHELAKEDVGEIKKFNVLDLGILSNKSALRINNIFRFLILKN